MHLVLIYLVFAIAWVVHSHVQAASSPEYEFSEGLEAVGVLVKGQDCKENDQIEVYARSILQSRSIKVLPQGTSGLHGSAYLLISRRHHKDVENTLYRDVTQHRDETTVEFRASAGGAVHHSIWAISVERQSVLPPGESAHLSEIKEDVKYMLGQFTTKFFQKQTH